MSKPPKDATYPVHQIPYYLNILKHHLQAQDYIAVDQFPYVHLCKKYDGKELEVTDPLLLGNEYTNGQGIYRAQICPHCMTTFAKFGVEEQVRKLPLEPQEALALYVIFQFIGGQHNYPIRNYVDILQIKLKKIYPELDKLSRIVLGDKDLIEGRLMALKNKDDFFKTLLNRTGIVTYKEKPSTSQQSPIDAEKFIDNLKPKKLL